MSASNPALVSVLIANYNYGRHIGEAIASVCAQDYGSVELLVVDDGSSDNSVDEIEKALAAAGDLDRVELKVQKRNAGKLAALNSIHELMRGDYCLTLDADDRLKENYISYCVDRLNDARQTDSSIAFVYSDCNLIDEEGNFISRGRSTAFDPDLLQKFSFVPEPAIVIEEAYRQVIPFDPSIRVATKHHKWLRLVEKGWSGLHIAEPLFYYRMHDKNISGIGKRVTADMEKGGREERILSGYWTTSRV